jgi:outer membrane protein TolC
MRVLLIALILSLGVTLWGQTQLNNLDSMVTYALENNLEYKRAQINLEKTMDNVASVLKLENSKFSTGLNYDNKNDLSITSSVNLPVIDQLAFTGSINNELKGTVGLNFSPLNFTTTSKISGIEYEVAQLNYISTTSLVEIKTLEAALKWMAGVKTLDLLVSQANRLEVVYQEDKDRYNVGAITPDDVQGSLINWSEARKKVLNQRQALYSLENSLYSQLGGTKEAVGIKHISLEELGEIINSLLESLEGYTILPKETVAYKIASYSTEKSEITANSTWRYKPDITGSIKVAITPEGVTMDDFSASLNFSFSPGDIKNSERDRALREAEIAREEEALKLVEIEKKIGQYKYLIEISQIESEILENDLEEAKLLYKETEILYKAGDYSELELLEKELFVKQSQINLFNSYITEYLNILNYLKF